MSFTGDCGFLHGGDYNYEQWLDDRQALDQDLVLMKEAGVNALSIGIFAWSLLESEEGVYHFDWLDECFERLYKNGQKVILATPSGSKPAWLSEKYPEVRMMTHDGIRRPHGGRHNHCRTSVKYREACVRINTKLAERYGGHPALILWHVSNEYNGEPCYCPQCLDAFRLWLKARYSSLDALNAAWYTSFWSHRFNSWEQIFPDNSIDGLMLDWQRFTSDQTINFYLAECEPLRRITPNVPITANLQTPNVGLDYHKFARKMDIVSWNSYPEWHAGTDDASVAANAGFLHDLCRSYLRKPFLLMESSPGATNWRETSKKKREGMHALSSLQAIAHGSDSVMYFQWRQSRGCAEKFHDAVVSHFGTSDTRIFREVAKTGSCLKKLEALAGTCVADAQVAVIYDFQNEWALNNAKHPRNTGKNYQKECIAHYGVFWKAGIPCDVIGVEYEDFSRYRLLVLPMLYLLSEETAEKLRAFVKQGGVVVATYMTGLVNGNDLCYLGGTPSLLSDVFGLAVEETDVIADYEDQKFTIDGREWQATHYADRARLLGAQALAEFNAPNEGFPAVCAHQFEKGKAYYLCARFGREFLDWFYPELCGKHGLSPCVTWKIPAGVSVQKRGGAVFVMNFNSCETQVAIGDKPLIDLLSRETVCGVLRLAPYGVAVLKE